MTVSYTAPEQLPVTEKHCCQSRPRFDFLVGRVPEILDFLVQS